MAKLPPLRNLRKTTIIVIAVFLGFLIHRLIVIALGSATVQETVEFRFWIFQSRFFNTALPYLLNINFFNTDITVLELRS